MMTFGLALVTARLKRNLGFLGSWRLRSLLFLSEDGHERAGALQEVKDKYERYCRFRDNGSFLVKRRIRCSMFATTAAQQQVELLEKSGWVLDQEVSAYAMRKSLRFVTSQLCEDGFNRVKRAASVASDKQVGSERLFHTLIERQVTVTVHRYDPPDLSDCRLPGTTSCPATYSRVS